MNVIQNSASVGKTSEFSETASTKSTETSYQDGVHAFNLHFSWYNKSRTNTQFVFYPSCLFLCFGCCSPPVPANTKNSKFFCNVFVVMQLYSYVHNRKQLYTCNFYFSQAGNTMAVI